SEPFVGFHRVRPRVLQLVCADLIHQTDAPSFLPQIKHHAPAFFGNTAQGGLQLGAAVATLAKEAVAGQALGMDTREHWPAVTDLAQHNGEMFFSGRWIDESV